MNPPEHDNCLLSSNVNVIPEPAAGVIISSGSNWREGRRIVDLSVLADGLRMCGKPGCFRLLHLSILFGLGSVFDLICGTCHNINKVCSGGRHGFLQIMSTV